MNEVHATVSGSPYGYAVNSAVDWIAAFRFANRLLRTGWPVLVATGPLASAPAAAIERGTFIVPAGPPELPSIAGAAGVALRPLAAKERTAAAPLAPVRVGLYGGGGAPFNHAAILAKCGFAVRFISDVEIRAGELDFVDVLVVPGGGTRAMHGQLEPLGETGCRAIADFVRQGGMYIGCCAGSYDCAITPETFVQSCPMQRHLQLINARVWNDNPADFDALQSPGVGVLTISNEQPGHPVMYGLPAVFDLVHYNGPVFDPLPDPVIDGASAAVGLAAFAGWTERFTAGEEFAGPRSTSEPTLLQRAIATGRYSAVAGYFGRGRVVAFGSHPEFGFDLAMARWGDPARLLANAVRWQAMSRSARPVSRSPSPEAGPVSFPPGSALADVPIAADEVSRRVTVLAKRAIEPRPQWLTPNYAMAVFGLPPDTIWRTALDDIQTFVGEAAELAKEVGQHLDSMHEAECLSDVGGAYQTAVTQVDRWLLDERPLEWRQDGGYQGVLALLRTAAVMCDQAIANWEIEFGPPAGPYGYIDANPYHLVAGSYLAAIGCVAGAVHLLRALAEELQMLHWIDSAGGAG